MSTTWLQKSRSTCSLDPPSTRFMPQSINIVTVRYVRAAVEFQLLGQSCSMNTLLLLSHLALYAYTQPS